LNQVVFVSATPAEYEKEHSVQTAEQIIRPTGLMDPKVEIRPIKGQVDDLMGEIKKTVAEGNRVLVTTLTKKMAEDLSDYLDQNGIKVKYIHHSIDTMERMEIIRDLRLGTFDVLVGINLLREGLDIPEVALVGVLDADKEGLLRSETSLIQTIGRAARNADGRVILYADVITKSIKAAVSETERRRTIQQKYNDENGITPQTVRKAVRELIDTTAPKKEEKKAAAKKKLSASERENLIRELTAEMRRCASQLEFERAAYLRDRIKTLREEK
ncbi:MAG: UvrB/UvrC motif-containing protein, partial [Clostridia bacterium]|nr:UvrB/UvrC motif-containing protein [Clostridia bacterium]